VDSGKYCRLVGKLNYLTVTKSDIAFVVSIVSHFFSTKDNSSGCSSADSQVLKKLPDKGLLYSDCEHTRVTGFLDADWTGSLIDGRSTTHYYIFLGGNLVS